LKPADLDFVAATAGPGLIGGVLVGLVTGRAMASAIGVPFIAVNHLEGHALSPRLGEDLPFPYLLFLGLRRAHPNPLRGRCRQYERWGTTIGRCPGRGI
jgi:N6-L-threonylcarbamoyladenine synthase